MITKLLSRRLKAAANEVYTTFVAPSEQIEFGMHPNKPAFNRITLDVEILFTGKFI